MGSFVVANPRRLGIAATQDDKSVRVKWEGSGAFAENKSSGSIKLQNAPLPSPFTPIEPCHPE